MRERSLPILLASVWLLVLGNSLQGTLLGVRAAMEGMAHESIGLMMSAYFAGFVVGSALAPHWVKTVGHIRAFAAFASVASAIALLHILLVSAWPWTLLRSAHGFCYAGLIVVAESWINGAADPSRRGRTLALYQLTLMIAWAAGQTLLGVSSPAGFTLFLLVSILLSLSLVPVTLGSTAHPGPVSASRVGLGRLLKLSPLGVAGVFAGGVCANAFFGMGPVFALEIGLDPGGIAVFMTTAMLGAVALLWPLGWLSDRFDRRLIIIVLAAGVGATSLSLAWQGAHSLPRLLPFAFAFGAFLLSGYPICAAHVNDRIDRDAYVAAASGLILVYGIGSALGPFLASLAMSRFSPAGLFLFTASAEFLFAAYALYRLTRRRPVPEEKKEEFAPLPRTTHVVTHLEEPFPKIQERDRMHDRDSSTL